MGERAGGPEARRGGRRGATIAHRLGMCGTRRRTRRRHRRRREIETEPHPPIKVAAGRATEASALHEPIRGVDPRNRGPTRRSAPSAARGSNQRPPPEAGESGASPPRCRSQDVPPPLRRTPGSTARGFFRRRTTARRKRGREIRSKGMARAGYGGRPRTGASVEMGGSYRPQNRYDQKSPNISDIRDVNPVDNWAWACDTPPVRT